MLKALPGLPDDVIGFEADGEIHADDYKTVLIPAVEQRLNAGKDIRIVLVFPDFAGYSGGAAWEDLKMGLGHLTHWKRIALVTDVDWMIHLTNLFGWMTPGELKRFPASDRDPAIAWAAG